MVGGGYGLKNLDFDIFVLDFDIASSALECGIVEVGVSATTLP